MISLQPQSVATGLPSLQGRLLPSTDVTMALSTWRELQNGLGEGSVACSAEWTETWIDVYGRQVPHSFLIAEVNGVPQGICLITTGVGQKSGPFNLRTVHIGTAGERQPGSVFVEYNRLLVAPEYREQFVALIANHLNQDSCWEQLRLDGFSEADLSCWLKYFPHAEIRSRDSRYFDLSAGRKQGQSVLDQLGKSTRSNLRRRLKQYGQLDVQWADDVTQAEEILNELIVLHQARWQAVDQPGAFASEYFLNFQQNVMVRLFLKQQVVLFRVRHQGETVGCLMLLVDRNRLLDYLSGFADFNSKPSPGLITHLLCMEEALQRGYDAYDFLVGDKRHKENLSNSVQQLCWLTSSRPTLKLRAIEALRSVKQRFTKRSAPATPAGPFET